jgi:thiol-disulfide isomerase/thioredoxin
MPRFALRRVVLAVALVALPGRLTLADPPAAPPPPPQAEELAHAQDRLLQKDYKEAVKAFRKADKLAHGNCAECQLGLARTFNRLGAYKDAEKSAAEALRLAGSDHSLELLATSEQGFAVFSGARNDADLERAAQLFRQVLERSGGKINAARFNLAGALLRLHRDSEGVALLEEYLKQGPEGALAETARSLIQNPERARKRLIPDFALVTLDGQYLTAEQLKGKVILVDFWGTWCGPCRAAVPALRSLAHRWEKEPFVLLSVSTDTNEAALKQFVAKNEMTWPQVWDEHQELVRKSSINHFPTYWVVSAEGEIVFERSGWGEDSERELSRQISDALRAARKANKS